MEHKACPVPRCGKSLPPADVLAHFLADGEMLGCIGGCGGGINEPPEERPASWDSLGCKAEGADEGFKLLYGTGSARFPFVKTSVQVLELIQRESCLKAEGVQ